MNFYDKLFIDDLPFAREEIFGKGEKPGEFVGWIDIVFDDVKGEVVKAAEGPDDEGEKRDGFEIGMFGEEDGGGEEAEEEEKDAFDFNPAGVG